jgi:hypothetical protein
VAKQSNESFAKQGAEVGSDAASAVSEYSYENSSSNIGLRTGEAHISSVPCRKQALGLTLQPVNVQRDKRTKQYTSPRNGPESKSMLAEAMALINQLQLGLRHEFDELLDETCTTLLGPDTTVWDRPKPLCVFSGGTHVEEITGTTRASSSLHQLAVWPPRTATMGIRWGDTHVVSAVEPEWAPGAAVSGRFWPLRARNGQQRSWRPRLTYPQRERPSHALDPWTSSLVCMDRSRNAHMGAIYWMGGMGPLDLADLHGIQ